MNSRPSNRRVIGSVTLTCLIVTSTLARGQAVIDCPLRDAPHSIDSPLIDVLLDQKARATVDRISPALLQALPPALLSIASPGFSAIVTLRTLATLKGTSPEALQTLNSALSQVPLTAEDRQARCARYDVDRPELEVPEAKPRLLLFEKMTGFRDAPSVEAARTALLDVARRNGWAIVATDRGGAIAPDLLKQFDAVIWNNVSGDVLTLTQRNAFRAYIESGGGFVGLHGSAGDPVSFWDWYVDVLVGARFAGHPMSPQFQDARLVLESAVNGVGLGLPEAWTMNDEWYSFRSNPRATGATVILRLDESTYSPVGMAGKDIRMGDDHPVAWTRCVKDGRSFYSAIGHRPEVYSEPNHVQLLEQAIRWAAGMGLTRCSDGKAIAR